MSVSAADKAQREGADPGANVFVTANAGSGKTKVLIDRIARLLLTPGAEPASFLCVTYTKAAAAEMQRRLFERLGAWSVMPDERLAKALGELLGEPARDAERLARARGLFARALETPGGLKIQTIHAFCERLLARFPLEAGVAPGFEIADDAVSATLRAEAIARAAMGAGPAEAGFMRLAARLDPERFDRLGASLLAERSKIEAIVSASGGIDRALAELHARHGDPRSPEDIVRILIEEAPWDTLKSAAGLLSEEGVNAQKLAASIRQADATRTIEDYLAIFCTQEGKPRSKPIPKGLADRDPWIARLFSDLGEMGRTLRLMAELKSAERAADGAAALAFGAALARYYAAAKARRGALDFEDLILAGRTLLEGGQAAAWVLYKLDGGLDHILIDEGQDTSPAQWALLAPLQEEFFAGEGARDLRRTVFAVGDPKQSIYSFQGADPARFLAEAQHLSLRAIQAGRRFSAPQLQTSFRSAPEILRAVDLTFEGKDLGGGAPDQYDIVRHLASREGQTGLVEWWPIVGHPEKTDPSPWDAPLDRDRADSAVARLCETLARQVRNWIERGEGVWTKEGLRAMRPGDVLALVRTRGPCFEQLLKAFKRVGLPVAGADRLTLKDDLAVEDLLAVAKAALDPDDDLSLACVLKGPFVGLVCDDLDLFPLAEGRARGERLIDRLRATDDTKYAPARAFMEAAIAASAHPPYAFFSNVLERTGLDGRSGWGRLFDRLGEEARDAVEELLARAIAAPAKGQSTLTAFVCAIEADETDLKRQMEESGDAVRIMTVHGSKGLEAPVVLLPDTVDASPGRPKDGLFLDECGLVFSPSVSDDDEAAKTLAHAAGERAAREHLRLLYVALTRPRDRLIVCGHAKGGGEGAPKEGSWHRLVGDALAPVAARCDTPFGEGWRLGEALLAPPVTSPMRRVDLPAWASALAPAEASAQRLRPSGAGTARFQPGAARADAIRRGVLIHGLLERLPDIADAEREALGLRWLKKEGMAGDAAETALAQALKVLRDPAFAAAFAAGSRAEAAIVGAVAGRKVVGSVDRLWVGAGEVLVIDYKTNRAPPVDPNDPPEAYARQMALYRAVLRQAFPGRDVHAALLWTAVPRLDALSPALLDKALATLT